MKKLLFIPLFLVCCCAPSFNSKPIHHNSIKTPFEGVATTQAKVRSELTRFFPNATVLLVRKNYYLPSKKEVDWLVTLSRFDKMRYEKDRLNCVDYSKIMSGFAAQNGIAMGECYKKRHSYNFCLLRNYKIVIIEPQNDKTWVLSQPVADIWYVRL